MIAPQLLLPEDLEDLALNINGKKRKLKCEDFNEAMYKAHIPKKAIENLWKRIENGIDKWPELIKKKRLLKKTVSFRVEDRVRTGDFWYHKPAL